MNDDHLTEKEENSELQAFIEAFEVLARWDPQMEEVVKLLRGEKS
jgi:hypothetical protein